MYNRMYKSNCLLKFSVGAIYNYKRKIYYKIHDIYISW